MFDITLPLRVGETIYVVEDYNSYYGPPDSTIIRYDTVVGKPIKITEMEVEGYIISEDGVHFAEDGHDGWNRLETYHRLSLDKYPNNRCKLFYTFDAALDFVKKHLE